MGVNKTPDGRVNVGLGYSNLNQYKGYAGRREIVIQLTATGATQDSLDALDFLKSYAVYHNNVGEPIFPASTNVFISNNGVTKAVEADEVTVDGTNVNIGGCVWNGTAWDFTNAGQGGGSSGGGALVVHDVDGTLDKTWQEIYDAISSGKIMVLPIVYEQPDNSVELYIVTAVSVNAGAYTVRMMAGDSSCTYTTSSADEYPVYE